MLWNLLYEFYVRYIFGGVLTNGNTTQYYQTYFGEETNSYSVTFSLFNQNIRLPNYMSLIATIITMIIILIVIGHFIKKAFNVFGRII